MIQLILMSLMLNAQSTQPKTPVASTETPVTTCAWPNICVQPKIVAEVQSQPCVWPNRCETPVHTCDYPNKCS